jgi:hypothetical protein
MADWLKLNHPLVRSPKIRRLARVLGCSQLEVLGLLVKWLVLVDEQTTDGNTGASVEDIDDELGMERAVDGLIAIGWAELDDDGTVCAVDFGKHCGDTAKARALNARNNQTYRARKNASKNHAPVIEDNHAPVIEDNHAPVIESNHQKRKEENRIINSSDDEFIKPSQSRAGARELPEDEKVVLHFMKNQAICGIRGEALESCAASFFDEMDACGWVNGKGVPVTNWQSQARSYLRKWQNRAAHAGSLGIPTTKRSDKKIDYTENPEL